MSENPAAAYSRLLTAQAIIRCCQSMIPAMDSCQDTWQEFWDVVNASGAYTDEELIDIGITAAQLASYITVIENFNKFMTAGSPANDNYKASLNTARRLSA